MGILVFPASLRMILKAASSTRPKGPQRIRAIASSSLELTISLRYPSTQRVQYSSVDDNDGGDESPLQQSMASTSRASLMRLNLWPPSILGSNSIARFWIEFCLEIFTCGKVRASRSRCHYWPPPSCLSVSFVKYTQFRLYPHWIYTTDRL